MDALFGLIRMGCICGKEALRINDRRFYLRSRLGEGGFSYVDLIEEIRTHKDYALKRITCHSNEEERIALQEIELMRTFQHPNIIPLEASSVIKVNQYSKSLDIVSEVLIVMPYYSRGSLQDVIEKMSKKSERFPEESVWELFKGICLGLQVFHKHNPPYAHRDLKMANIMLADDGTAIIMDLGSANKARVEIKTPSQAHTLQDEAAERCSMFYRAPELFNPELGSSVDERTDIWSLGCLLYALAYLTSPFESDYNHGGSIALAAQSGRVKFPEDNRGYSKSLQETILLQMKVNSAERPFIDGVLQHIETVSYKATNRV
ncbi:serine/threonine-protein kinase 16-like [Mytilus edulis]